MKKFFLLFIFCLIFFYALIINSETIDNAIKKMSFSQKKVFLSANEKSGSGDYQSAINEISDFLKKEEGHYLFYLLTGNAYSQLKKNKEALEQYMKGLKLNDNSFELNANTGKLFFNTENYRDALKYLTKSSALKTVPDKDILKITAANFIKINNYFGALKTYEKGIYYYSDDLDFVKGTVYCFIQLEKYDDALAVCLNYSDVNDYDSEFMYLMAQIYTNKKQYSKAVNSLLKIELSGKADTQVFNMLGDLYSYLGMYEESSKYYLKNINSENDNNFYKISLSYYYAGKYENALEYINKSINIKNNIEYQILKCNILFELKEYEKIIKTADEFNVRNGELFYLKGISYMQLNKLNEAENEFHNAKLFDSVKDKAFAGLGDIYYLKQDIKQSLIFYKNAYKFNSKNEYKKMIEFLSEH